MFDKNEAFKILAFDTLVMDLFQQLYDIGLEEGLLMDGYDDCIVGILERFGMEPIILYDKKKVIGKLMAEGCTHECGNCGHMWFNNSSAWSCEKCGSGRVSSSYDEEGMEYMEWETDETQEGEEE